MGGSPSGHREEIRVEPGARSRRGGIQAAPRMTNGPGGMWRRYLRDRVTEADAVKVPGMPHPQQYRSWRAAIRIEITAAGGRGEAAFLWGIKPEANDATYEGLRDSEGLDSLDAKLATALNQGRQRRARLENRPGCGKGGPQGPRVERRADSVDDP